MFIGVIIVGVILGALAGVAMFVLGYGLLVAFLTYVGVGVTAVFVVGLCQYLVLRRRAANDGSRVSIFGVTPKRSSGGSETDSRI